MFLHDEMTFCEPYLMTLFNEQTGMQQMTLFTVLLEVLTMSQSVEAYYFISILVTPVHI